VHQNSNEPLRNIEPATSGVIFTVLLLSSTVTRAPSSLKA